MKSLGKERSGGAVIALSLVTLGVYYMAWYYKINAEIRRHDPTIKVSPFWALIASMVPFANVVSAYATAARIRQMQLDEDLGETISPNVALAWFLLFGIGYPLYLTSQLSEHWHSHRLAEARKLESRTSVPVAAIEESVEGPGRR